MAKKTKGTSKFWWIYLILGILVLICGGNLLANPLATLTAVSFLTGLYFVVSSVISAFMSIIDRKSNSIWWVSLILNIIVLFLGIIMLSHVRFILSFLWLVTSLGFILEAVQMIISAITFKKTNQSSWIFLLIFGILIGICGLMILGNPIMGLSFVAMFVAFGVICFGINLLVISFQTKPSNN